MELIAAIGDGPVALDSAIFIYFLEQHPRYLALLRPLFMADRKPAGFEARHPVGL